MCVVWTSQPAVRAGVLKVAYWCFEPRSKHAVGYQDRRSCIVAFVTASSPARDVGRIGGSFESRTKRTLEGQSGGAYELRLLLEPLVVEQMVHLSCLSSCLLVWHTFVCRKRRWWRSESLLASASVRPLSVRLVPRSLSLSCARCPSPLLRRGCLAVFVANAFCPLSNRFYPLFLCEQPRRSVLALMSIPNPSSSWWQPPLHRTRCDCGERLLLTPQPRKTGHFLTYGEMAGVCSFYAASCRWTCVIFPSSQRAGARLLLAARSSTPLPTRSCPIPPLLNHADASAPTPPPRPTPAAAPLLPAGAHPGEDLPH